MPLARLALRINEPFSHYNYSVVPPLSGSTSILPAGTRDTLTQTRTHGFGLIAICGTLGAVVDAQRAIRRVTADSYQGHAPSTYRTWLQGIDPRTAGTPAYTSYIGAKVAQHFETGWGVGVVCCIAADPRLKSMTRTPAPDALRPTKSQPFSIIWGDNNDFEVEGCEGPAHSSAQFAAAYADDVQRSPRPKHGGIPRSCSPLSFLRSSPPTGSRSASTCRCSRFGKSGPRR